MILPRSPAFLAKTAGDNDTQWQCLTVKHLRRTHLTRIQVILLLFWNQHKEWLHKGALKVEF